MTEPITNEQKTYWNDMPEGQQNLYKLCAKITALHETTLDSKHPLTSSPLLHSLMDKAIELYKGLEQVQDFASDDRATQLIKTGERMKNLLSKLELEKEYLDNGQIVIIDINSDDEFKIDQLQQQIATSISQEGYRRISIRKTNLEKGDFVPIGDYVRVDIEKKGSEKLKVEYFETYDFGEFLSSYWDWDGDSLLKLAKVIDPKLEERDINERIQGGWGLITKKVGPITSSVHSHDYNNNFDYDTTVECKNLDQVREVSRFFLETIKNNPRVEKIQKNS